jgi:uncharacterized protein
MSDRSSVFGESLRAHALVFERPLAPSYASAAGARILVAFVAIGVVLLVGLRFAFEALGIGGQPLANLALVVTLLAAFFAAQRGFVRLPSAVIGLRPWREWTRRERLYLVQVGVLASIAFGIVFRDHLQGLLDRHGPAGFLLYALGTGLLWGVAQELLYRGWLQTELTRRFGGMTGLLAANLVFTFGPLHLELFVQAGGVRWGVIAAVFAIGLVFGLVYRRSGNLWIPAVLHGLWPLNMA